jgi:hypothetical protein
MFGRIAFGQQRIHQGEKEYRRRFEIEKNAVGGLLLQTFYSFVQAQLGRIGRYVKKVHKIFKNLLEKNQTWRV